MALIKGEKNVVLLTKIPPILAEKTITQNGTYLASEDNAEGYDKINIQVEGGSGTKDIYFANVLASDDNWFTEEYIKPVMQTAYDAGYHDILINTLNGTRYAVCKGADLQELSTTTAIDFRFVNLANSIVEATNPTRLSTDGVLISEVKLDADGNIIFATSARAEIQYIDVLTKDEFSKMIGYDPSKDQVLHHNKGTMTWTEDIDGGTW